MKLLLRKVREREMQCIIDGCDRASKARGLCVDCYGSATYAIKAGKTTWEALVAKGLANKSMRARSTFSEAMLKTACGTPGAVQGDRPIAPPRQAPLQEKLALEKGPPTLLPPVEQPQSDFSKFREFAEGTLISRADALVVVEGTAPLKEALVAAKDVVYEQTPLGITCRSKATGEPPALPAPPPPDSPGYDGYLPESSTEPASPPVDPDADSDDDFTDPLRPVNVEPAIHGTHGIGAMQPQLPNQSPPPLSDEEVVSRMEAYADACTAAGSAASEFWKMPKAERISPELCGLGKPCTLPVTDCSSNCRCHPDYVEVPERELIAETVARWSGHAIDCSCDSCNEGRERAWELSRHEDASPIRQELPAPSDEAGPSEDDLAVGKALGLVPPTQPAPLPWEKDAQKPLAE
jgi:hypothetical protein